MKRKRRRPQMIEYSTTAETWGCMALVVLGLAFVVLTLAVVPVIAQ